MALLLLKREGNKQQVSKNCKLQKQKRIFPLKNIVMFVTSNHETLPTFYVQPLPLNSIVTVQR